ncbi:MAG: glycosyltransferase family 4 protein [Ruminococcaceae bacterium]|nr:glycosyltransferase family 4 protein [Oscillospiraceae bacterium]
MKRILIAIGTLGGGGAERVVSVWTKKLIEQGYDVHLLIHGRTDNEYEIPESAVIHPIAATPKDYAAIPYLKRLKKTREIVKSINPDLLFSFLPTIQIWMMFATIGLKLYRVETVRNSPWHEITDKKVKFLWKKCFKRCNAFIVQTPEQQTFFSEKVAKKAIVITNPVSPNCYANAKTEFPPKIRRFVAAGRITSQKNYPMMLDAFKKALAEKPDITLSIYGGGTEQNEKAVQDRITEMGLQDNVFLMGKSSTMHLEMKKHDAFLMSSDYEGMPNALLEAMVIGLIAVSTDCRTGPKDIIDHGVNGYLTPVGNADEMAKHILHLTDMTAEEISAMARDGQRKVADLCDDKKSFDTLIRLIEEQPNA